MTDNEFRLTQEQIDQFHRDGFLSLDAITALEEVDSLREIYDNLFSLQTLKNHSDSFDLAGTGEEGAVATLPQIMNPSKYAPELTETIVRRNAIAIARQLLGDEADFSFDHAIRKPPAIGAVTPWHQDEAYWNPGLAYESLSIWVPLQEATLENGCMQFIPGTHKEGVLPHHSIGRDTRVPGLETDQANPELAVPCPLPPGGATIHHCRTLHYTGANTSDNFRRAYIMAFGVPPQSRSVPRDFPWLTERKSVRDKK